MDDLDTRLAALELLLIERIALDPLGALRELTAALQDRAFEDGADERTQAIAVLDDAICRLEATSKE